MSDVAVIGTGYVGLVSGACLADFGNRVVCIDIDSAKIDALKNGKIPIYEPGIEDVVARNVAAGRLSFSTDAAAAIREHEVVFIAVGTPPAEDGSADLRYIEQVARLIGQSIEKYSVIVDKSTVPVGTARRVKGWVQEELAKRGAQVEFDVVSNPEFLREGAAVEDFMRPDRVVIGAESEAARHVMKDVYRALYINETPYIETGLETAEMIKYASNAFLAVKITFINEVANLCEKVGANVQDVARAMGRDGRIGPKFLHPGPGYGGSCFPKDTQAMARIGRDFGEELSLVEATIRANEAQKERMVAKIADVFASRGGLAGKTIALLGLAFKPNTDDMREAPALTIIDGLLAAGAKVRAFDPVALHEARWRLAEHLEAGLVDFARDEYDCLHGADALVLVTEWNQFRSLDLDRVRRELSAPLFLDLRNVYRRADLESRGFVNVGVGQ